MLPEFLARFFVALAYSIAGHEKARMEILRKESLIQANQEADAMERAKFRK